LSSSNTSSTCPDNTVNFGPLAAEIDPVVWGTPANFNGFLVLAALLHGSQVLGVSQTLRRWTEGATYIRQGGHDVGHWPTFLVISTFIQVSLDFWSTFHFQKVANFKNTSTFYIESRIIAGKYFYHAMHFSVKRGIVIIILSVCLSVCYIRDPWLNVLRK